jgi:hypothetical protein
MCMCVANVADVNLFAEGAETTDCNFTHSRFADEVSAWET